MFFFKKTVIKLIFPASKILFNLLLLETKISKITIEVKKAIIN